MPKHLKSRNTADADLKHNPMIGGSKGTLLAERWPTISKSCNAEAQSRAISRTNIDQPASIWISDKPVPGATFVHIALDMSPENMPDPKGKIAAETSSTPTFIASRPISACQASGR